MLLESRTVTFLTEKVNQFYWKRFSESLINDELFSLDNTFTIEKWVKVC